VRNTVGVHGEVTRWREVTETEGQRELTRKVAAAPGLTPEEVQIIREALAAYRGWQAMGRAGKALVVLLGTIAAGIAAWNMIVANLRVWWGGG
jgi:hypothetical protein